MIPPLFHEFVFFLTVQRTFYAGKDNEKVGMEEGRMKSEDGGNFSFLKSNF